jgi:hypothetical protein
MEQPAPRRVSLRLRLIAAAGDATILLAFAAIGRASHREQGAELVPGVLGTAAPFLVGWYAAALLLGVYRADTFSSPRKSAFAAAYSWLPGGLIGLAIRSALEGHVVPVSFAIVALSFNLPLLLLWHAAIVLAAGREAPEPESPADP